MSLLFDRTPIGATAEQAAAKLRLGVDALTLGVGDRGMVILPFLAVEDGLDAKMAAQTLWRSAGQPAQAAWSLLQCETWLEGHRLQHGFPERQSPAPMDWDERLAAYIMTHATAVDAGRSRYVVTMDKFVTLPDGEDRCLVALDALGQAGRAQGRAVWETHAASRILDWLKHAAVRDEMRTKKRHAILRGLCTVLSLTDDPDDVTWQANADWLTPLCEWATLSPAKALPLESLFGIRWAKRQGRHSELRNWVRPVRAGLARVFRGDLFGLDHSAAAASELLETQDIASDLLEVSDRIMSWQNIQTGVFVPAMSPLGSTAEGALLLWITCLAWPLLDAQDDRRERYREAWRKGLQALSVLHVTEEDRVCLPNPRMAEGGQRDSGASAVASLNAAGHMLNALTAVKRAGGEEYFHRP